MNNEFSKAVEQAKSDGNMVRVEIAFGEQQVREIRDLVNILYFLAEVSLKEMGHSIPEFVFSTETQEEWYQLVSGLQMMLICVVTGDDTYHYRVATKKAFVLSDEQLDQKGIYIMKWLKIINLEQLLNWIISRIKEGRGIKIEIKK